MKVVLDIPDYELEQEVTVAFRDVLPFVAKVVRADALLKSLSKDEMIRLTSSRKALDGVSLLQEAVDEIMHPIRPYEVRDVL